MNKYQEIYNRKLTAPLEAVKNIKSGSIVIFPLANGAPPALMDALADRIINDEVKDLHILSALEVRISKLFTPEIVKHGSIVESGFVGPLTRYWCQQGVFTGIPVILSTASEQAVRTRPNVNTVMCVVSPMDKHGFFSMGINPDWAWDIIRNGKEITNLVVEVNEHMPRTFGNTLLHVSEVSAIVENNLPLICLPDIPMSQEDEIIGEYIAEQIPDGATIQLGIGGTPNAVAKFLKDKKNLGVHSEMLTDSMLELYEQGVITCTEKTFAPYKWLGSFALGTQKLYDFLDDNPMIEMQGVGFVNNPHICAQNNKLMAINSTLQVDLTGQCNSEALGHLPYSGIGGQADFVRGAWNSPGGKAILATYSTYTDKDGNLHSKIVPTLDAGSPVTTHRGDVQYIVTEYGITNLKGYSFRDRAKKLISIAHPDFRDKLTFEARRLGYLA